METLRNDPVPGADVRRGLASALGVLLFVVAFVVAAFTLVTSISVATRNTGCGGAGYACPGGAELVLIAAGLALIGIGSAALFAKTGAALYRYGSRDETRWQWSTAFTGAGAVALAFGWLVAMLYYLAAAGRLD